MSDYLDCGFAFRTFHFACAATSKVLYHFHFPLEAPLVFKELLKLCEKRSTNLWLGVQYVDLGVLCSIRLRSVMLPAQSSVQCTYQINCFLQWALQIFLHLRCIRQHDTALTRTIFLHVGHYTDVSQVGA